MFYTYILMFTSLIYVVINLINLKIQTGWINPPTLEHMLLSHLPILAGFLVFIIAMDKFTTGKDTKHPAKSSARK